MTIYRKNCIHKSVENIEVRMIEIRKKEIRGKQKSVVRRIEINIISDKMKTFDRNIPWIINVKRKRVRKDVGNRKRNRGKERKREEVKRHRRLAEG